MALLGIPEEKRDRCPDCGSEKDGVVFCPAEYQGDFIVLKRGQSQFRCEDCFRVYLGNAKGEVILGPRKWLVRRKPAGKSRGLSKEEREIHRGLEAGERIAPIDPHGQLSQQMLDDRKEEDEQAEE